MSLRSSLFGFQQRFVFDVSVLKFFISTVNWFDSIRTFFSLGKRSEYSTYHQRSLSFCPFPYPLTCLTLFYRLKITIGTVSDQAIRSLALQEEVIVDVAKSDLLIASSRVNIKLYYVVLNTIIPFHKDCNNTTTTRLILLYPVLRRKKRQELVVLVLVVRRVRGLVLLLEQTQKKQEGRGVSKFATALSFVSDDNHGMNKLIVVLERFRIAIMR